MLSIMPIKSPLYPPPPYHFQEFRKLSAFCEGDKGRITSIIPPPLEYISNIFEVSIIDITKISGLRPYREAAIVVPVKYKEIQGGHVVFEYTTTDDALCCGREIWGYPKKLLDKVELSEMGNRMSGAAWRNGVKIISISFKQTASALEMPNLQPRLQIKTIPRADRAGEDLKKIIRISFVGYQPGEAASIRTGEATVSFEPSEEDPIYKLMPVRVLGGIFATGSFTLGYGEEIADLTRDIGEKEGIY